MLIGVLIGLRRAWRWAAVHLHRPFFIAGDRHGLPICQRRTPIAVQLESDCRIAIQTKKTARCCGATGPRPVKIVRSNPNGRPGQSGGLRDRSMSICSRLCSALMQTQKPCASVARQSSIRSAR